MKVYQSKADTTCSSQPLARHTVVMGTTASLKTKAPAVPVRAKIYSSFNKKAPAPQPPTIPAKPVMEPKSTPVSKPSAPTPPAAVSKTISNITNISKTSVTFKNGTSMAAVTITSRSPPATSAAAAAAIAAANQIGSPDSSVSDKDEWGTPEGAF